LYWSSISSYVEKDVSTSIKINDGKTYLYSMKFTLNEKVETYINGKMVWVDSISWKWYSWGLNSMSYFALWRMWSRFYEWNLDDVRIYNRWLSDSEIKELYNSIK